MRIVLTIAILSTGLATAGAHSMTRDDRDRAAIVTIENSWSSAAANGDASALDRLLAPNYISVSANGATHDKAHLLASARQRAASQNRTKPILMDATSTIDVRGAFALVHHRALCAIAVDVLERKRGSWVAVYSQHTEVSGPAGTC